MPEIAIPAIGEVMTPSPVTIDAKATLTRARQRMEELGIKHLPVMVNGVVESVVSDREIKRFTLPGHKAGPGEELLVEDVVPHRAVVADRRDPLDQVLKSMMESRVEAVIVLDEGELAGIFTETDACNVLVNILSSGRQ